MVKAYELSHHLSCEQKKYSKWPLKMLHAFNMHGLSQNSEATRRTKAMEEKYFFRIILTFL